MVIFLTGLVSMILMRTLRNDYAKYAREEDDLETLVRFKAGLRRLRPGDPGERLLLVRTCRQSLRACARSTRAGAVCRSACLATSVPDTVWLCWPFAVWCEGGGQC